MLFFTKNVKNSVNRGKTNRKTDQVDRQLVIGDTWIVSQDTNSDFYNDTGSNLLDMDSSSDMWSGPRIGGNLLKKKSCGNIHKHFTLVNYSHNEIG